MKYIQNPEILKSKIVAFLTEKLNNFTKKNPEILLEAIGLDLDSYTGTANISLGKEDYYKESIARYIELEITKTILSEKIISELKLYILEGYVYHLSPESAPIVEKFKNSMGDWSHIAIETLQVIDETELEFLRSKENPDGTNYVTEFIILASEALLDYLQSEAFTKVNKKNTFVFLVLELNDSVEEGILKFNKVRRANLRFVKNDVELKQKTVLWLTEKLQELHKKNPSEKWSSITFDMNTFEAKTYLSVNTKQNFEESLAKVEDKETHKFSPGYYKYCAFEELILFNNNQNELEAIKAIPHIEGNWYWTCDLAQVFIEALLDFQKTDTFKNLNLETDTFVFAVDSDQSIEDSISKFNIIKTAYLD